MQAPIVHRSQSRLLSLQALRCQEMPLSKYSPPVAEGSTDVGAAEVGLPAPLSS